MKNNILALLGATAFVLCGCNDVLDRPQLNSPEDSPAYWSKEDNLRLYANEYYPNFFQGYNTSYNIDYAPVRGYTFSDDCVSTNVQTHFESNVPDERPATATPQAWMSQYAGPSWYFGWVRKSNIFLDRISTISKSTLSKEACAHWTGVAKFFKALEYSRLVASFGDVPYFEKDFNEKQYDVMYKDRTPRGEVMDSVYQNFKFALDNVRKNDGAQFVNKYVVAGFVARWMLFEGTWQKYHLNDQVRAKKYLEFARDAAEIVMNSGKYMIMTDFRSLFGSEDLGLNKECLLYRHYDAGQNVTHCIASYSNGYEAQNPAINLSTVKAFICNDGKAWQNSSAQNANSFSIADLVKTRDPRFEATFWHQAKVQSASLLYVCKFIDREGPTHASDASIPAKYGSNTNTNDFPVMRYSEVLLSWIEAKAELATLGSSPVTQSDIDKSINVIRNRPLDTEAVAKGVKKTAPMDLNNLPVDPSRDNDVSALIWEIRRERRMEFVFEHSRLLDIKRWKKIQYMSAATCPDNLKSIWVNIKKEVPALLVKAKEGKLQIMKEDGTVIIYNGSNGDDLVGYYLPEGVKDRNSFTDRVYLSPVGSSQITLYSGYGYKLTQTPLWQ